MRFTSAILAAGLALAASASPVEMKTVPRCAQPWFDHNQYDCYGNGVLCHKIAGSPQKPCGDACYNPFQFSCNSNRLIQLHGYGGAFEMIVHNPQALPPGNYSNKIQACGRHFYLQDGPACTYCPEQVVKIAGSCPSGKDTVLVGGTGLNTVVPGGQRYYVEPNGALGFTQAHSGQVPNASIQGLDVFENGAILVNGLVNWLACPSIEPGKHYQIFAPLNGVKFPDGCIPINILVQPYNGTAAAWQYV